MSKIIEDSKENCKQFKIPTSKTLKTTNKINNSERKQLSQLSPNETGFFDYVSGGEKKQSDGKQKLFELTGQCVSYFNRFTVEKDNQIAVVHNVFLEISTKVQQAFGQVISQAQNKMNQIRNFLVREEQRLLSQKKIQQEELNRYLKQIQDVHLTKMLTEDYDDSKELLSNYAGTLENFFNVMMQVQRNNYEDSVEECVNFINNLIREELRGIVQQKFPKKIDDIINNKEGLSNEQCFTFEGGSDSIKIPQNQQQTCSLFDPIIKDQNKITHQSIISDIQSILKSQKIRSENIKGYSSLFCLSNPFKGVQLSVQQTANKI